MLLCVIQILKQLMKKKKKQLAASACEAALEATRSSVPSHVVYKDSSAQTG